MNFSILWFLSYIFHHIVLIDVCPRGGNISKKMLRSPDLMRMLIIPSKINWNVSGMDLLIKIFKKAMRLSSRRLLLIIS